jgi:uncharacterized protein (TIGR03435 family)
MANRFGREKAWIMRAAVSQVMAMSAHAQQQPAPRVEFEVVSLKPGDPASLGSSLGSSSGTPAGRLVMRNTTLKNLVMSAYRLNLNEYEIAGGPTWMDSAKFNIDAKLPADAPQGQIPLMMQTMLADRFKLESHRETRTLREYALVVAKGGPKFGKPNESDHKGVVTSQSDNQITGWGRPLSDLARMLIGAVGAPVVDQTGLKGQYDFDLKFAPLLGASRGSDDALPDVFAVLQGQLGLKLEAIKGPVELLVIDRAEKPTEN